MYTLVSTRFNNDTWRENGEYRLKHDYLNQIKFIIVLKYGFIIY